MQTSFFNTTKLSGADLKYSVEAAVNQNECVLRFFIQHRGRSFTPIEVYERMGQGILLTSVRRALTTLTKQGRLTRTNQKVKERHGAVNYKWTINSETF